MIELRKYRADLYRLTYEALRQAVEAVCRDYQAEEVYAFVVYPNEPYDGLGVAFSTRGELRRREPDYRQLYEESKKDGFVTSGESFEDFLVSFEVTADEWSFLSEYHLLFTEVNELLASIGELIHEEDMNDINEGFRLGNEFDELMESILVEVLSDLKASGKFVTPPFESDVLMGIQFPDSNLEGVIERSSKALNSQAWHKRLVAGWGG